MADRLKTGPLWSRYTGSAEALYSRSRPDLFERELTELANIQVTPGLAE